MSNRSRIVLVVLILLAAAFRMNGLFENTFQADEALFASWARQIAVWRDPLLTSQPVDKPPLLFYLQALFYPIQGAVPWAARLPNFVASLMIIPMTALLVWRLYRNQVTTLLAAAFIAFSPMAIQFSASAFIDPLMSFLIVSSLVVVAGVGHPGTSGLMPKGQSRWSPVLAGTLFGLAALSKHQAWMFLPLSIGLALMVGWRRTEWCRWLIGLFPILVAQVTWELLRSNEMSLLAMQWQSYGGIRLTWSWELWPRLHAWALIWGHILKSPVIEILLILVMPLLLALLIDEHDKHTALDRLFALFVVAYTLLLWFIAVPVWDRYVLALLPYVSLLLARFAVRIVGYVHSAVSPMEARPTWAKGAELLLPLALLAFQFPAIVDAYQGKLPIGATPSADRGVALVSESLRSAAYGTVLYDHWYSWQWRYHLFDDKVYVSWFPDPDTLVEDLQAFGREDGVRYIALPNSALASPVKRAIAEAGFSLEPRMSAGAQEVGEGIVLYQIKPGSEADGASVGQPG